jgi:hypothetical protein
VTQCLIDALTFQNFKIDPRESRIGQIFFGFYAFGYRIRSRRLGFGQKNSVSWTVAYHEGLHNVIGLRFGTKLKGRPMITLLNECLGIPLEIYFMAKLVNETNLSPGELDSVKKFKFFAKQLGVSFEEIFKRALKDPFLAYKEVAVEAFTVHNHIFNILKHPKADAKKLVTALNVELKRSKNLIFYSFYDMLVPVNYIASNCGFKSNADDLKCTKKCLQLLHSSQTLEEFFMKLDTSKNLENLKKGA